MSVATGEALGRARRIVSPRVGIVAGVSFLELAPDEPRCYLALSRGCDAVPIGGLPAHNDGNAASFDPQRAVLKAVGESVERYCAAIYDDDELTLAPFDELGEDAVPPDRFALFSERQHAEPGFRFPPFTNETVARWVRGHSLVHDRPTLVPAQFVYVPYRCRSPQEPPFHDLISTGLAAGPTLAAATYRAAVEVIERDAFSIVWQNRLPRPRIELERVCDPLVERLLEAFRGVPVRLDAVLLTLDVAVPVVLVVITTAADRPPLTSIGLGTDLNPARAVALALEEAALGFLAMRRLAAASRYRPEPGYAHVTDLHLHGLAHAVDPALRQSVEFLTHASETVATAELPDRSSESALDNLVTVVHELDRCGFDAAAVDVTTPDVDEVGYKVVRVVVPGLQPLDNDHTCRHLGGTRLYDVPFRLGVRARPADEHELNPDPHPFP